MPNWLAHKMINFIIADWRGTLAPHIKSELDGKRFFNLTNLAEAACCWARMTTGATPSKSQLPVKECEELVTKVSGWAHAHYHDGTVKALPFDDDQCEPPK